MNNRTFSPLTEPARRQKSPRPQMLVPILLLIVVAAFLIFSKNPPSGSGAKGNPAIPTREPGTIEALFYDQLPELLEDSGGKDWNLDEVIFNGDKTESLIWMAEKDPDTGETLAREPQTILAQWNAEHKTWQLHLSNEEDFAALLNSSTFKDSEYASQFSTDDSKSTSSGVIYGGYKLPWRGGQTKRLTWSVGHNSCAPGYCTYAFDFADGTMFDILATKSGFVYHWRDTCNNGDSSCTNSITLEDRSTTPWTYMIYLHIANNSIPPVLKNRGIYVQQGQKVANADDTGASTGHHLHFMVVERGSLNACTNYCWGRSVDITFRDVNINWDAGTQGGRPRLPSEAEWYGGTGRTSYTSGNTFRPGPGAAFQYYLPTLSKYYSVTPLD